MRVEQIEFWSEGETCRGDLYLPDGDGPFPGVVFAGGWLYVKEINFPDIAAACAQAGIASLAFDYRRLGLSDGEPRQHVAPWDQVDDLVNALCFMETRPEVDPNRLALWGISIGGGYALILASLDPRVACVVSVIPAIDGWEGPRLIHGAKGMRRYRQGILDARRERFRTGEHSYHPPFGDDPDEFITAPFEEIKKTFEQIKATVAPRYEQRTTYLYDELYQRFTVYPYVNRIVDTPVIMFATAGDDVTFIDLQVKAFDAIPSPKKKLVLMDEPRLRVYRERDTGDVVTRQGIAWVTEHLVTGWTGAHSGARMGRLD